MEVKQEESIIKPLMEKKEKNPLLWPIAGIVILGLVSGWLVFRFTSGPAEGSQLISSGSLEEGVMVKAGETYGRRDDTFADSAEGTVEVNKEDGEGTHKLLREGGESQTAYLTSSVLDLDLFIGRKVKVWGQTFSSEKVGWLMDVGKVEVLE